ncbi:MAG: ribosome biogenesis GTP-binding protein YihA/YsxC [Burkholderiaceae bacterium]|jgi:GTP-binding protein
MSLLQQARFFTTADAMNQLPRLGLPELAFAGRSNSGKSSAINSICSQRRLAFSSKTPGRTQHINYFAVGRHADDETVPGGFLVDLPGYGYAQVSRTAQEHWRALLGDYLHLRGELAGLVLVMDARRPLTELDEGLIAWFAPTGKPIHALLTKSDKLNRSESVGALRATRARLKKLGERHTAQLFSNLKQTGVEEARVRVLELLGLTDNEASGGEAQKKAPTQGE